MSESTIGKAPFGKTPDGRLVELYTLRNRNGMEAGILTFGGVVASLKAPDRNGNFDDVVLGYDNLDSYIRDKAHFGGIIGRYGNRIAKGRFKLNGSVYSLATNNGDNHLHGGLKGFDKAVWTAHPLDTSDGPALQLSYLSRDGEEGFPGNLSVTATYTLTNDNALRLDFTAGTDKDTICNLTNHSYFNLRRQGDVLDHVVQIIAEKFTPTNSELIPTGELRSVTGTPFDFRQPTAIGARINSDDGQIRATKGYDQNWVFDKPDGQLGLVASVWDKTSGRRMEVWTTEPGMQFYTANCLDNGMVGKGGQKYQPRDGFCMEPQHFPDSPNQPDFPAVELKPGQTYKNTIIYKFSAE
jgi:aldose 1-epimerase